MIEHNQIRPVRRQHRPIGLKRLKENIRAHALEVVRYKGRAPKVAPLVVNQDDDGFAHYKVRYLPFLTASYFVSRGIILCVDCKKRQLMMQASIQTISLPGGSTFFQFPF
jgi:hypothetical protein